MIDRMIYLIIVTTPKGVRLERWLVAGSEDRAISFAKSKWPNAIETKWSGQTGLLVG